MVFPNLPRPRSHTKPIPSAPAPRPTAPLPNHVQHPLPRNQKRS
jgi:hypothetical protein